MSSTDRRRILVPLGLVLGLVGVIALVQLTGGDGRNPSGRAVGEWDLAELPGDMRIAEPIAERARRPGPEAAVVDAGVVAGAWVVRLDDGESSGPVGGGPPELRGGAVADAIAALAVKGARLDRTVSLRPDGRAAQDEGPVGAASLVLRMDPGAAVAQDGPLPEGLEAEVEALAALDGVRWVEPLRRVDASAPDDPYFAHQWHLDNHGIPALWAQTQGADVVVAVLDSGVSNELDGFADLMPGFDFVDLDSDASDSGWHGTHVAGTVAQRTNNGVGTAGVAPRASILPVRVLGPEGGDTASLAEGIVWAVDQGADIINLSLGFAAPAAVVEEACQYAADQGVLVVAASGNDWFDDFVQFPAAYETVLAVGAVDRNEAVAPYSNRGVALDIVAAGGDLSQDVEGDGIRDGVVQAGRLDGEWTYVVAEGTSTATPHVAGVAALLVAQGITELADLRDALLDTAEDLGPPGHDYAYGFGLLDPAAALAWEPGAPGRPARSAAPVDPEELAATSPGAGAGCDATGR